MLKIGEFSRLSQVTVKTLHHYDEIGLLKPSHVDQFTEYRYYTLDQLSHIHSIMALKDLGLSLDEITQVLLGDLPPETIRGMFQLKQAEAQQRVQEEQTRLARIAFRLRQIEQEGRIQTVDIVIKRVESFSALIGPRGFYSGEIGYAAGLAIEAAKSDGRIKMNSHATTHIYYEEEFQGDYSDREVALPVDEHHPPIVPIDGFGSFTLRQLPAIEAAATYLHPGAYETLNEKYLFLQRWAVEHGYKLSGTWRFVYHRGPMHQVEPEQYLTELQHPIEYADNQ